MKGDVIYAVRLLRKKEKELIMAQCQGLHKRIIWQQFEDGFPSYRHYGINLGDGSVIHFRGDEYLIQSSAWIQRTSMRKFLGTSKLEVEPNVNFAFSRDEVVYRALSQLGTNFGGYNFLFNNCEHFANWCATGKRLSKQVLLR